MISVKHSQVACHLKDLGEGSLRLEFSGRLNVESTSEIWNEIFETLAKKDFQRLVVDGSGLEYCDGAGVALILHLERRAFGPEVKVEIRGLKPEFSKLLALFGDEAFIHAEEQGQKKAGLCEQVGGGLAHFLGDLRTLIIFLGELVAALFAALTRPRLLRWREVLHVMEIAGVDALPIVGLISFLVGLILAFQSATPLATYGAQIYVVNLVALTMMREMGAIMTAILLAGRTGSAFAAEIGTMKVNEELNALETMGLNPVKFLVVNRVVAGVLVTPMLVAYAIFVSLLGCFLVMLSLGYPLVAVLNQLIISVRLQDLVVGLGKGFVFGVLVSAIGCQRGIETRAGASAVGASTTNAVVSGILLIIFSDFVMTLLLFYLKI